MKLPMDNLDSFYPIFLLSISNSSIIIFALETAFPSTSDYLRVLKSNRASKTLEAIAFREYRGSAKYALNFNRHIISYYIRNPISY